MQERLSIWESIKALLRRVVLGSVTGILKLGQGRDAAKKCIEDNPELADELEAAIMEALKPVKINILGSLKRKEPKKNSALFFL